MKLGDSSSWKFGRTARNLFETPVMLLPWMLILVVVAPALPFPGGAPGSTCTDMTPRHGGSKAQATRSPFALAPSGLKVAPGAKLTVTLSGGNFKGYLLQAVLVANKKVVGNFTQVPSGSKAVNCNNGRSNAVTHSTDSSRSSASLVWQAPSTLAVGNKIMFRATVLQNYQTYWTNVVSSNVVVSKK